MSTTMAHRARSYLANTTPPGHSEDAHGSNTSLQSTPESVYIQCRHVRYHIHTSLLSYLPDSILVTLFPTGLTLPKALYRKTISPPALGIEDQHLDYLDDSLFIHVNFEPKLLKFLVDYFHKLRSFNDTLVLNPVDPAPAVVSTGAQGKAETPQNETHPPTLDTKQIPRSSSIVAQKKKKKRFLLHTLAKIFTHKHKDKRSSLSASSSSDTNSSVPAPDTPTATNEPPSSIGPPISTPFSGLNAVKYVCMLKEELDYYLIPFKTTENPPGEDRLAKAVSLLRPWKGKKKATSPTNSRFLLNPEDSKAKLPQDTSQLNVGETIDDEYVNVVKLLAGETLVEKRQVVPYLPPVLPFQSKKTDESASQFSIVSQTRLPRSISNESLSANTTQTLFVSALKGHTHFIDDWMYRELESSKNRILSVVMLNMKEESDVIRLDELDTTIKRDLEASNVDPSHILSNQQAYACTNSVYQSIAMKRPVRKCWWETATVTLNSDDISLKRRRSSVGSHDTGAGVEGALADPMEKPTTEPPAASSSHDVAEEPTAAVYVHRPSVASSESSAATVELPDATSEEERRIDRPPPTNPRPRLLSNMPSSSSPTSKKKKKGQKMEVRVWLRRTWVLEYCTI